MNDSIFLIVKTVYGIGQAIIYCSCGFYLLSFSPAQSQCRLGRHLPLYQVAIVDPCSRFVTIDMGRGLRTQVSFVNRESGSCCALFRGGKWPQSYCWAVVYLLTKWHLDPSNHLTTIHQRCRQRDNGPIYSIVQTVLETVAQKLLCQ